jgi:hypothetical protein
MPRFTVFGAYRRDIGLIVGTVLHGDFAKTDSPLSRHVADSKSHRWVQAVDAKDSETAEMIAAHTYSEAFAGDLVPLAPGQSARVSIEVKVHKRPKPWQRRK